MLVIRHIARYASRTGRTAPMLVVKIRHHRPILRQLSVTERRYSAPAWVGERMTPLPAALQALRPVRFAATGAAHSQNSFRRCLIPEGAPHYACIAAPAGSKPGLAAQS